MKQQTKLLLIVAILVSAFWSCKDSTELTNAIPSSAITVIHFDTKSILTKADYKPLDNKYLKEALEKEKERGSENTTKMVKTLEDFLRNPNSTGIDLIDDCYMYMDSLTMGVLWQMNDAKKLKDLLVNTMSMPEQMLNEEDGITTLDMMGAVKVGWTKDKLMLLLPYKSMYGRGNSSDMTALLKKRLTQKAEESINSNKAFVEFAKNKKDISVFYSYDNISGMWEGMSSQMMGMGMPNNGMISGMMGALDKVKDQLKGVSAGGFVSFEKGEITMENAFYYDSPETEKRFTELAGQMMGELKGDQMKYFVGKPIFIASGALNGGGMYNYLSELGLMSMFEEEANKELSAMNVDLKSLISNVEGDITLAINGINTVMKKSRYSDYEYPSTEPEFTVFADLKDAKSTWDLLKKKIKETEEETGKMSDSTLVEINETTYSLGMGGTMRGYAGIKDNTIYLTNSEEVYKNIAAGTDGKNDFAAMAKGKTAFIFGNLNMLKEPLMNEFKRDAKAQEFVIKGFDLLGDYSYVSEKNLSGKGKFVITDNSRNSLAVICSYINEIITYAIEENM